MGRRTCFDRIYCAFLLAFRNEDVEGKHKAGLAFAIGIAMVGFPAIFNTLGIMG